MRAIIFDLDHTIFTAEQKLHDGTVELLDILKRLGIVIGGISNHDHRILVRLDEAGIRKHFTNVLCADQTLEPKASTGLQHLLSLLGAEAYESILVSHAHADILLAKEAKLFRSIGVAHGQDNSAPLIDAGADYIVQDIPAILDVVE